MNCQHFCTEEKLDSDVWEPDTGGRYSAVGSEGMADLEKHRSGFCVVTSIFRSVWCQAELQKFFREGGKRIVISSKNR